jgi:hypothetical protein
MEDSYKAITYSEFDISKVSFSKPRKASQGSVVNVKYLDRPLVLQTPLMSTFGLSRYEDKWSLCLSLYAYNQQAEHENAKFRACIEELEEKLINELVGGLYKEWLCVGDKWDKFSKDLIRELVLQKCDKRLLKHSKKDVDKRYAPTMNIKLNKNRENGGEGFYVSTFMLGEDNRIIQNENGDCREYDIMEKLYFDPSSSSAEDRRIRPKVYCLFSLSIWLINGNIFLTPVCNQVLIQPVKPMMMRVTFNEKGFCKYEDTQRGMEYDESKGYHQQGAMFDGMGESSRAGKLPRMDPDMDNDDDDDEMPARA